MNMKKLVSLALIASAAVISTVPAIAAAQEAAASVAQRGTMLYTADGKRVANVYRVTAEGDAQLIYRGKMITVAAATLTDAAGKLTTSLTADELRALR